MAEYIGNIIGSVVGAVFGLLIVYFIILKVNKKSSPDLNITDRKKISSVLPQNVLPGVKSYFALDYKGKLRRSIYGLILCLALFFIPFFLLGGDNIISAIALIGFAGFCIQSLYLYSRL